jgi:hypothetical protein
VERREQRAAERIERVSLIDWICVRAAHRTMKPADISLPLSIHDDGRWAFCPSGLAEDAGRFRWPDENEVGERPAEGPED